MGKILVVAEKPSAGADMAKVLGVTEKKKGYMEGDRYIVTWALGHLVGLKDPEEVNPAYKKWRLEDLPLPDDNGLKILPGMEAQFGIIRKLIHRSDVDSIINAGDAGREGYLIQSWIYRMAGNTKPVKVLWASSLTEEALGKAFRNLKEEKEFLRLLEEAEARAIGDQKFGYNYSRLLTLTRGGRGTVLSYGRCQTPLLNLIVSRDLEIDAFQPTPYFGLEATYSKGFKGQLMNEKGKPLNFLKKTDAQERLDSLAMEGVTKEFCEEEKTEKAPLLYNLAQLQAVAGKKYGYPAEQTLSIAQSLYEKHKILSYPRTDSRALSMDLYGEIRQHLESCRFGPYTALIDQIPEEDIIADKKYFNDNKVTDHHALIPTINQDTGKIYTKLTEEERNLFDEVVRSLIAIFYPPYQYSVSTLLVQIGDSMFRSSGKTIRSLGYREVLRPAAEEKEALQILPALQEGDRIRVDSYQLTEKKTTAPVRYNVGNIIKAMEKYGIGTSATRAEIIKKLEARRYITLEKGKYISTDLGRKYIAIIPEELKSPDLTGRFEERLSKVSDGSLTRKEFLGQIDEEIRHYLQLFAGGDGEKLGGDREAPGGTLGSCPACGKDVLEGKKSYYCSGYKEGCKFFVMKAIAGKEIPPAVVIQLLSFGATNSISGFRKKSGDGTFSAKLALDENYQVIFRFDFKKKKGRHK
ncbi:MAG: DNA topoisomerase [Lachnospiraceae bacterium]|nr:DNA topoisomerase [Lachnospiraceae bacterium]